MLSEVRERAADEPKIAFDAGLDREVDAAREAMAQETAEGWAAYHWRLSCIEQDMKAESVDVLIGRRYVAELDVDGLVIERLPEFGGELVLAW